MIEICKRTVTRMEWKIKVYHHQDCAWRPRVQCSLFSYFILDSHQILRYTFLSAFIPFWIFYLSEWLSLTEPYQEANKEGTWHCMRVIPKDVLTCNDHHDVLMKRCWRCKEEKEAKRTSHRSALFHTSLQQNPPPVTCNHEKEKEETAFWLGFHFKLLFISHTKREKNVSQRQVSFLWSVLCFCWIRGAAAGVDDDDDEEKKCVRFLVWFIFLFRPHPPPPTFYPFLTPSHIILSSFIPAHDDDAPQSCLFAVLYSCMWQINADPDHHHHRHHLSLEVIMTHSFLLEVPHTLIEIMGNELQNWK